MCADLLASGAGSGSYQSGGFPVHQEIVLLDERCECATSQCVLLDIIDTAFDLAFMARCVWLGRQDRGAVMFFKGAQLGRQFGIVPVGRFHSSSQVVDDNGLGNAAKVPKCILDRSDKIVGGLPKDDFGIALAGMTHDDTQDMRSPSLAVLADDGRSGAEVDLGFPAGLHLDAAECGRLLGSQLLNETTDAPIAALEVVFVLQVLEDPLSVKALLKLGFDDGAIGLAVAGRFGGGRSVFRDALWNAFRGVGAGGRAGPFWLFLALASSVQRVQMSPDSLPINTERLGNLSLRLTLLM